MKLLHFVILFFCFITHSSGDILELLLTKDMLQSIVLIPAAGALAGSIIGGYIGYLIVGHNATPRRQAHVDPKSDKVLPQKEINPNIGKESASDFELFCYNKGDSVRTDTLLDYLKETKKSWTDKDRASRVFLLGWGTAVGTILGLLSQMPNF